MPTPTTKQHPRPAAAVVVRPAIQLPFCENKIRPTDASSTAASIARARGQLVAAAATWGTYPVVLRALYAAPGPKLPPLFIVAVRFVITSGIFCAFQAASDSRSSSPTTASASTTKRRRTPVVASARAVEVPGLQRAASELATIGLCGNFLSVWGISHVAAALAETLLGCVHIFVPLITVAVSGSKAVGLRTWQACALSFTAVCVAAAGAVRGGAAVAAAHGAGYPLGLAALVGAAGLYSLARVRTEYHVGVRKLDSLALNRRRMGAMGGLATCALLVDACTSPLGASRQILAALPTVTSTQWLLVITSCLASGFVGSSLQFQAQKVLPAASMQPYFALQPLFACGWTWAFLAEPIAPTMLSGGALMLAGALVASTDSRTVEDLQ